MERTAKSLTLTVAETQALAAYLTSEGQRQQYFDPASFAALIQAVQDGATITPTLDQPEKKPDGSSPASGSS